MRACYGAQRREGKAINARDCFRGICEGAGMNGLLLKIAVLVLPASPIVVTGLWAIILCADAIKRNTGGFSCS